jgi:hypothetical protein
VPIYRTGYSRPERAKILSAVPPDPRWILYATNEVSGTDLLLVENFH